MTGSRVPSFRDPDPDPVTSDPPEDQPLNSGKEETHMPLPTIHAIGEVTSTPQTGTTASGDPWVAVVVRTTGKPPQSVSFRLTAYGDAAAVLAAVGTGDPIDAYGVMTDLKVHDGKWVRMAVRLTRFAEETP